MEHECPNTLCAYRTRRKGECSLCPFEPGLIDTCICKQAFVALCPGWNKISETGMPKRGDYSVLVYHKNGSIETCHVDDLYWSVGLNVYTHWMKLPEAPNVPV
jgi:hypothetical protein